MADKKANTTMTGGVDKELMTLMATKANTSTKSQVILIYGYLDKPSPMNFFRPKKN